MSKCFWKLFRDGSRVWLLPSDRHTHDLMMKRKDGDIITTNEPRRPRHPKHHRKYWAMIGLVHESTAVSDLYPTTQKLHDAIKGELGYWTPVKLPSGKTFQKLDSTSFESMAQDEFEKFYAQAVEIIVQYIVPHLNRDDLAREVEEMLKP